MLRPGTRKGGGYSNRKGVCDSLGTKVVLSDTHQCVLRTKAEKRLKDEFINDLSESSLWYSSMPGPANTQKCLET